jgi:hypothetical protein
MINRFRRAWDRATRSAPEDGLHFDRPLLLFQSDDWGRVGVRDREGWEQLQASGVPLGERPYDFYTLETGEDLHAIRTFFAEHHDSVGRTPSIVMNFILANVDFDRCAGTPPQEIPLVALSEGLPSAWQRPGLFEAYRKGIQEEVFYPALHGLTHFCFSAVTRELKADGERAQLIRKLWRAQTPYIHWRMPWIGYEYWDAELSPDRRFLPAQDQRVAIHRAVGIFRQVFQAAPFSACAPGYRANDDTRAMWYEAGVRVAQNGHGDRKAPYLDNRGMLHTFRTIEIEPATGACDLDSLIREAETCFTQGLPAIVSIHSINFHSTLRDFRTPTLTLLDRFLTALETKWPSLLYVHDADLFHIAKEGSYRVQGKRIEVAATIKEARPKA